MHFEIQTYIPYVPSFISRWREWVLYLMGTSLLSIYRLLYNPTNNNNNNEEEEMVKGTFIFISFLQH